MNRNNKVILVAFIVALLAFVPFSLIYYPNQLKQDWRGAIEYLRTVEKPGDEIVVLPHVADGPFNYYYRGENEATFTSDITIVPDKDIYIAMDDFAGVQSKSVTLDYLNRNYKRNDNYVGIHIYQKYLTNPP